MEHHKLVSPAPLQGTPGFSPLPGGWLICAELPLCFSGGPGSLNTCFPFEEEGGFLFGCLGNLVHLLLALFFGHLLRGMTILPSQHQAISCAL